MARRPSRLLTPQGRSPQPGVIQSTVLGVYIHIPFCSAICNYCNFNRGLFESDLKARYVDALVREIERAGPRASTAADTIYFGGGTPSLLDPSEVARIIAVCRDTFDVTSDAEV